MAVGATAPQGGAVSRPRAPDVDGSRRREHLVETIRRLAGSAGDASALTFLDYRVRGGNGQRGGVASSLTYAELDRRVRAVAGFLRRRCAAGDRAAILCPHDEGYVIAFLACLYADVIGVPVHAPEVFRDHTRLGAVIEDCTPTVLLTTTAVAAAVGRTVAGFGHAPADVIRVDEVPADAAGDWRHPDPDPDAVAYLQYTSGSTGRPAGVRVMHRNLTAAVHQVRSHFPQSRVTASWVPFFHDFGLVCGFLVPLSNGAHSVHLSPMAFVQDPHRWLRVITDYRVDWTIAPSFSLAQCVGRVTEEQKQSLDLSSLRLLTLAAEPVHAGSTEAFAAAFARCGLEPGTLAPCYGLAEATLPVSAPRVGEGMTDFSFDRDALAAGRANVVPPGTPNALRLVGCGQPRPGVSLRIVDPATRTPLPDGRIGEIWLHGPNIADGYWQRPERSREVFGARLAAAADDRDWLRTGDLGFVHGGALFIAGRSRDLIIIRGRNHYPDDIEATVLRAAPGDGTGMAAAFSIRPDDLAVTAPAVTAPAAAGTGERLVVLLEADRALLSLNATAQGATVQELRREITRAHGVEAHEIVLVRRGVLPRTTSGKIRRGACRAQYLRGDFRAAQPAGTDEPRGDAKS